MNFIDLKGKRFGRLIALKKSEKISRKGAVWECICDCGNEKYVDGEKLRSKNTRSCGCLLKEKSAERKTTHGKTKSAEYNSWRGMVERCTNPNAMYYSHYGGRGITVCERWSHSFENFYADMSDKPSPTHSIERNEVNGNYEPSNCIWASKKEQSRNTRLFETNSSGYKGVHWHKQRSKWISYIEVNNKRIYLGYFLHKEDAINARKEAEIKYWTKEALSS